MTGIRPEMDRGFPRSRRQLGILLTTGKRGEREQSHRGKSSHECNVARRYYWRLGSADGRDLQH